nr:nymph-specific protein N1 [Ischnura senegalensis]
MRSLPKISFVCLLALAFACLSSSAVVRDVMHDGDEPVVPANVPAVDNEGKVENPNANVVDMEGLKAPVNDMPVLGKAGLSFPTNDEIEETAEERYRREAEAEAKAKAEEEADAEDDDEDNYDEDDEDDDFDDLDEDDFDIDEDEDDEDDEDGDDEDDEDEDDEDGDDEDGDDEGDEGDDAEATRRKRLATFYIQ